MDATPPNVGQVLTTQIDPYHTAATATYGKSHRAFPAWTERQYTRSRSQPQESQPAAERGACQTDTREKNVMVLFEVLVLRFIDY